MSQSFSKLSFLCSLVKSTFWHTVLQNVVNQINSACAEMRFCSHGFPCSD